MTRDEVKIALAKAFNSDPYFIEDSEIAAFLSGMSYVAQNKFGDYVCAWIKEEIEEAESAIAALKADGFALLDIPNVPLILPREWFVIFRAGLVDGATRTPSPETAD